MRKEVIKLGMCVIATGTLVNSDGYAQNVGINTTGASPNSSAALDIDFPDKGLLIPRVALTSPNDATTIPQPATSLLVYNTGTGGLTPAGYYYNAGTPNSPNWVKFLNTGTPSDAWLTSGNAGTTPGTHFIGTTDAKDLVFKTNNTERMRILGNNAFVGIGTATPSTNLHVIGSILAQNTGVNTVVIRSIAESWANHDIYVYHSVYHPAFLGLRGRGTMSAPAYPQNLDVLLAIDGRDVIDGYNTTSYGGASMTFIASEDWSSTNKGAEIRFLTTKNGTNTIYEAMRITNQGWIGIKFYPPAVQFHLHEPQNATNATLRISAASNNVHRGIQVGTTNGWFFGADASEDFVINRDIPLGTGTNVFRIYSSGQPRMSEFTRITGAFGNGTSNDAVTVVKIKDASAGNYYNDWLNGWGGGLSTWDICGASTYMNQYLSRSDKRFKTEIKSIQEDIVEKFMKLNPVTYKFNRNTIKANDWDYERIHYGFIANEVENIFPDIVINAGLDTSIARGLEYDAFIPIIVKVVQEQQKIIKKLIEENQLLKNQLEYQKQLFSTELKKIKEKIVLEEAKNSK